MEEKVAKPVRTASKQEMRKGFIGSLLRYSKDCVTGFGVTVGTIALCREDDLHPHSDEQRNGMQETHTNSCNHETLHILLHMSEQS